MNVYFCFILNMLIDALSPTDGHFKMKTQLIKSVFLLFTFTRRVKRDWILSLCFPVGGLVGREWQCYCVKKQPLQDPAV